MDPSETSDRFATILKPDSVSHAKIGNYEIVGLIGSGAMGDVFLAQHSQFADRQYAIKLLKQGISGSNYVERFQREIRVTGELKHDNVVYAHDAGETPEGHLYLVMDYVPGVDLQVAIERHGSFEYDTVAGLILQACDGLQCAHARGIIHRDIKPSNLLVTREGLVKVSDLGLAAYADRAGDQSMMMTAAHAILGTPHFMAPEIWNNPGAASSQSDLYAVACSFYALTTGKPPFAECRTLPELAQAHQFTKPIALREFQPELPPELDALIAAGLEKRPEDRPRSLAEFADQLKRFAKKITSFDVGELRIQRGSHATALAEKSPSHPTLPERSAGSSLSLSTWQVNNQRTPKLKNILIVLSCLLTLSAFCLTMAYFGPTTTEAWSRRFGRLNDSPVPPGTGYVIELLRSVLFLSLAIFVLAYRFANEVRTFFDLRHWNLKLAGNRVVVIGVLGLLIAVECHHHLDVEQAPAELAAWADEHGIDTTAEHERGPFAWQLGYSLFNYIAILGGLVALPLVRFTLTDLPFVIERLRDLRGRIAAAKSGSSVSRLLIHFGKECCELSGRYLDVMAVLVAGVHYDWWVGWRTLSESAQTVLMIGWVIAGLALAFLLTFAGLYANAYDAAFKRVVTFGSVQEEAEVSRINTLWFLRKNLLDSFSGLVCLSVWIVLIRAMLS